MRSTTLLAAILLSRIAAAQEAHPVPVAGHTLNVPAGFTISVFA